MLIDYDDIEFATLVIVSLFSIRQPARLIGGTSAELLEDEITDPAPHHVSFQAELAVRDSIARSLNFLVNATPKAQRAEDGADGRSGDSWGWWFLAMVATVGGSGGRGR